MAITTDQWTGPLRAAGPMIVGWLIAKGFDSNTAGLIVAALGALGAVAWSFITNRLTSMAAKVAETPGVRVEVSALAPPAMKTLAEDPANPSIVIRGAPL